MNFPSLTLQLLSMPPGPNSKNACSLWIPWSQAGIHSLINFPHNVSCIKDIVTKQDFYCKPHFLPHYSQALGVILLDSDILAFFVFSIMSQSTSLYNGRRIQQICSLVLHHISEKENVCVMPNSKWKVGKKVHDVKKITFFFLNANVQENQKRKCYHSL